MAARKKSRLKSNLHKAREAFETAQDTVQSRIETARDQASETWDKALFLSRVHLALQQLGVPSAEEIRLLTRRVEELNASVLALSGKSAKRRARSKPRKTARTAR
jgi:polyhydroxyalkanoate synthesis regulator phasin